ncbi:alpha/beta fold hydrolase [Pleomorphovibrio marinus]|uniref:alpha/beta fold hydrolase n=1 Tax=Pleomorphovibrio marinus TaxID=2164132 RepID=UPI000E0A60F0|nr:alpha/beta hydrolase [Pleomorphovibrio marinus]
MPDIAFSSLGTGQPVILIHGFCETKELWEDFQPALSYSGQVFCPDLPGFGESKLTKGDPFTIDFVAEQMVKWLADLNIKDPILIGHSLGGYVALAILAMASENIKAVGLFHSTAFPDNKQKKLVREKAVKFVENYGSGPFVENFIPQLFSGPHLERHKGTIAKLILRGKDIPSETIIAYSKAMRDRPDRVDVLKKFTGKKCFIAGEFDTAVSITASRQHQDWVDDYLEIKQCGHMGMFEKPNETLVFLQQFITKAK